MVFLFPTVCVRCSIFDDRAGVGPYMCVYGAGPAQTPMEGQPCRSKADFPHWIRMSIIARFMTANGPYLLMISIVYRRCEVDSKMHKD